MFCSNCGKQLAFGDMFCGDCGFEITGNPHHLTPGITLSSRYLVGMVIGEGGFGITYIGRDMVLDNLVAIKEYYPNQFCTRNNTSSAEVVVTNRNLRDGDKGFSYEKYKERFLEEARTLAKFEKDACIVNVKDFFEENNTAYVVMEYVAGHTLNEHLEKYGVISANKMFLMMRPLITSLSKVHEAKLIHRDISPDNIKISDEGILTLLDFGAARYYDSEKTMTNMIKAGYAPEEQYRSNGELGPWTDIYALCATIYKCITGVVPDDSPRRLHNRIHEVPDLKRPSEFGIAIDSNLEEVIMRGMSVMQNERYQSICQFIDAIDSGGNVATQNAQTEGNGKSLVQQPILESQNQPIIQTQYESYTELIDDKTPFTSNDKLQTAEVRKAKKSIIVLSASAIVAIIVAVILAFIIFNSNEGGSEASLRENISPSVGEGGFENYPISASAPEPTPEPTPEPEPTLEPEVITSPNALFEIATNSSDWIQINVHLPNSNLIVFERDLDSAVWTMMSADGSLRLVSPEITRNGSVTTLSHATPSSEFNFNAETTGTTSGEVGNHTFAWDAVTCSTFSRGSESGANNVYGLRDALERYPLISITVFWDAAGRGTTAFYRDNKGNWYVRSRFGWFTQTVANLHIDGDTVHMILTRVGRQDYFYYNDGSGRFDDHSGDRSTFRYTFDFYAMCVLYGEY